MTFIDSVKTLILPDYFHCRWWCRESPL